MSGFDLTRDPNDEDQHQDEVALAVDISDRKKGTFRVTYQDIPFGKLKAQRTALAAAWSALGGVMGVGSDLLKAFEEGQDPRAKVEKALAIGKANIEKSPAIVEATGLIEEAQRELLRWGIAGHQAEDFRYPKAKGEAPSATPFEGTPLPWEKEPLVGPNERMIRLYERCGLLERLSSAVLAYQDGRLLPASEEWARFEEKKKEAEQKKKEPASPTQSTPETSPAASA